MSKKKPKLRCSICASTDRELRPYGKGGALVCFPCATASPEAQATASHQFDVAYAAAQAAGNGVVLVGKPTGPEPLIATNIH